MKQNDSKPSVVYRRFAPIAAKRSEKSGNYRTIARFYLGQNQGTSRFRDQKEEPHTFLLIVPDGEKAPPEVDLNKCLFVEVQLPEVREGAQARFNKGGTLVFSGGERHNLSTFEVDLTQRTNQVDLKSALLQYAAEWTLYNCFPKLYAKLYGADTVPLYLTEAALWEEATEENQAEKAA